MFQLDRQDCDLSNLNIRPEFHGDQIKRATDLTFKATMSNSVLDMFDDELKELLFKKVDPDKADLADQGMDESYLSELRFPELTKKQSWEWKGSGYRLSIHVGLSGDADVNLINVDLDKFKFEAKQGGSVDFEFQAKAHPGGEDVGKIFELLGTEVELSLTPPSAEDRAQMEIDEMMGDDLDEA